MSYISLRCSLLLDRREYDSEDLAVGSDRLGVANTTVASGKGSY